MSVQRQLVHKQFNSPMGLYSQENVKETLNRELKAFGNDGIEIDNQISRPLNLASSEVLRAVEEEEQMKCEPSIKCERQSRSKQRFHQRPHTPVHQHQLEQIKTQYLSHQHDITIDRDTVLKINRLASRRNLHKREHSWPPTTMENASTSIEQQNRVEKNGTVLRQEQQHIRSTSIDNALQFDETVCKRHGIDTIREKFNSPTRIIEPTAQEVRKRRQQQKLQQQKQNKTKGDGRVDSCDTKQSATATKPKQMVNLIKHEELLRKNSPNKSAPMSDAQKANEKSDLMKNISQLGQPEMKIDEKTEPKRYEEDEIFKITTVPIEKGFSHPETKAADEDIGLVEPKRQYYEQLTSSKKWHSYENLNAVANVKPIARSLPLQTHKRQTYSLERGREARQHHKQLPPQKPRTTPKLQRRSMKLATEIKISYDTDAQQHNIEVKSLNHPKKQKSAPSLTPTTSQDDLEHIPLPAIPENSSDKPQCDFNSDTKSFKERQFYDDSCIFLRSIDLQDNKVAYIPAAITIVPSPTEEIMQQWMESSNLKAHIKGVNGIEATKATATKTSKELNDKNKNVISQLKHDSVKAVAKPKGNKPQQIEEQHQQRQHRNDKQNAVDTKAKVDMYVTHLPSTPNGIHLTRHAGVNAKCKTQMNNKTDNKKSASISTKTATNEFPQHARAPGFTHSNATSNVCNKVAKEDDKTQQQGVFYTDGEYVYGPYDPHNGKPLAHATVRSMQAEQQEKHQQLHQQTEIKKNIEAETKSQHKNEIANLTAKYENIQKSINEHLRQIDAYIENAKAALKSTISSGNKSESAALFQHSHTQPHNNHLPHFEQQQQEKTATETPLKEILRKITDIMQEVKPLYRNQKATQQTCIQPTSTSAQLDEEENMPIVDKVLMDLNMLSKHLSEFDKNSGEELKPIMEQLDLQFETRPTATTASHVLLNEETTNTETGNNHQKSETVKPKPPPTPPPLPLPVSMTCTKPEQEKRTKHDADKQLLVTDKLITAQTQSQQRSQQSTDQQSIEATTISTTNSKNMNFAATEDKIVIDTLGILENESKKNLVNTHVPAHDEKIKSNFNQQTLSPEITTSTTNNNEEDVVIMQNCINSVSANASGEDACHHDNVPKSTRANESQLKLHIKDFADKKSDKQFKKYDNPPPKNTNDVVNSNKDNNNNTLCQNQARDKHVSVQYHREKEDKDIQTKEDEGGSNQSSGSELSNTYKSSYELPSPYVTMRQISWEDVLSTAMSNTSTNLSHTQQQSKTEAATTSVLTKSVNVVKPEHEIEIAQVCTESPVTLDKIEPTNFMLTTTKPVMTSGHVGMQSATTLETCSQTKKQELKQSQQIQCHHRQHHCGDTAEEDRKCSVFHTESHLPARSTSPFVLNDVEISFKQRSSSVSPTRLGATKDSENISTAAAGNYDLMKAVRNTSLLAKSHSPCGHNSKITNLKRSSSISPKRTNNSLRTLPKTSDEMAIRKYPASLAEPHLPTRAASPFGLNAVDVFHTTGATTVLPAYELEVKSGNEQEQVYYDEHVDKPTSPIRKYPPSLIEPHVPTRAASPFGLNAVDTATLCTPSPKRTPHSHQLALLKSTTTTDDSCKKPAVYVPQVEGHNVGLLVRTSTPTLFCHTDVTHHASSTHSQEMKNSIKTPHDYVADITDNKCCAANNFRRADDDDDATHDELQRINAIGLTKQVKQPKLGNLNTTGTAGTTAAVAAATTLTTTTTDKTIAHHQHQQHQPQKQEQLQQQCDEHHMQNQEEYSGGSGQHLSVDAVSLSASVINRSFDNVSPRPYISIEGYKRVAWPPASEERIVREFTPQPQTQHQTTPVPAYNQQQQQHQPSTAAGACVVPSNQLQQQHHTVSHDQVDQQQQQQQHQPHLLQDQRGASPGIITLRKEAPITQKPTPIFSSQPAAISFRGGSNMRGDLKWPPPEYKEAAAKENEERRKVALGPVCRPRKINRDYTTFFAKNALSHHYPSYKVPPGTQHMIN